MSKFEIEEIVRGKHVSAPVEVNEDTYGKILDYVRNLPWFKNKRACMFILSIILVKSWEPKDEAGRIALMQHLDDTLPLAIYTTAFPELTAGPGGVLDTIHN